jgi:hypothetical protein
MSNIDQSDEIQKDFDPDYPYLKNRVMILNGFADQEIFAIMKAIKDLCKTGPAGEAPRSYRRPHIRQIHPQQSQSRTGAVIIDMSGDHTYLKENPPEAIQKHREERARPVAEAAGTAIPKQ